MSLNPGEDIGEEVHEDVDQFIRCEAGTGVAMLNGEEHQIKDGFVVVIPAGVKHNVINTSPTEPMKLYTLYAPPHHKDQTIHESKADAEGDKEHFDGVVTG
jgi:mannose-6-phosphate isomerase-like protein (cupin superfamily)